jgi:hypothetical protein
MACRECNNLLNPAVEKKIITDKQRPGSFRPGSTSARSRADLPEAADRADASGQ